MKKLTPTSLAVIIFLLFSLCLFSISFAQTTDKNLLSLLAGGWQSYLEVDPFTDETTGNISFFDTSSTVNLLRLECGDDSVFAFFMATNNSIDSMMSTDSIVSTEQETLPFENPSKILFRSDKAESYEVSPNSYLTPEQMQDNPEVQEVFFSGEKILVMSEEAASSIIFSVAQNIIEEPNLDTALREQMTLANNIFYDAFFADQFKIRVTDGEDETDYVLNIGGELHAKILELNCF